jgi:hypothetical protein
MQAVTEQDGLTPDTVDDCRIFWLESGMDEDVLDRVRVLDKGYGHLRGWMANGAADEAIVAVLRAMLSSGVHDSRDLGEDAIRSEVGQSGEEFEDWMLDEPLSTGWLPARGLQDCRTA